MPAAQVAADTVQGPEIPGHGASPGIAADTIADSDDPDAGGLPATFAGEAVCEPAARLDTSVSRPIPGPGNGEPPAGCLPRRYVLTLRADGLFALRVQELLGPRRPYGDVVGRWRQDTPEMLRLWLPPPTGALSAAYSPAAADKPARLWLPLGPGHPLAVLWRAEHADPFEAETIVAARVLPRGPANHRPGGGNFLLRDCQTGLLLAPRAGGLPLEALPALGATGVPLRLAGRIGPYLGSLAGDDGDATALMTIDRVLGPADACPLGGGG